MKYLATIAACLLSGAAWACATCFGDADSAQTQGMNMGIVTLLGVTGIVVGSMTAVTLGILLRMRQSRQEASPTVDEAELS
ncbi:MAG: hypothetical protein KJ060_04315 [Candidatus Hydrogenedentes bacterium]|nr:hypothetical protein [Candidatus Hydrogenedentota bacterium]